MTDDRYPQRPRHALEGDVVVGGADPARREHDVELAAEGAELVGDDGHVVRYHADPAHVDPELAQLAAEVRGVGVHDLARKDLVADEDDSGGLRHACRDSTMLECETSNQMTYTQALVLGVVQG